MEEAAESESMMLEKSSKFSEELLSQSSDDDDKELGDDEDDPKEHIPAAAVDDFIQIGRNEVNKMVVQCKICGLELLQASSWVHRRQHCFRLKCDHCCYRCNSEEDLENHLKVHEGKLIQCKRTSCSKQYRFRTEYLDHVQGDHFSLPDEKECQHCGKSFIDDQAIDYHCLGHNGELPHKCHLCGKSYRVISSLKIHFMSHTHSRPYECRICFKEYTRRDKLKKHMKSHEAAAKSESRDQSPPPPSQRSCDHHPPSYEGPVDLGRCVHCGLVCKSCGAIFPSRKLSRSHTHNNLCKVCGRKSENQKAHRAHERYHAIVLTIKCEKCQFGFIRRLDYDLHNMILHGIPIPGRKAQDNKTTVEYGELRKDEFICNVCNKSFASRSCLAIHKKLHSEHRQFQCQECGKGFTTKTLLKFHVAAHREDKPHQCSLCDKRFIRRTDLYRHQRTHEDDEDSKVECSLCGMKLKTQRNLRLHLKHHETKVHLEELHCSCGKKFLRKSHLTAHRKEAGHDGGDALKKTVVTLPSRPKSTRLGRGGENLTQNGNNATRLEIIREVNDGGS